MYTRCTQCRTIFRISREHLNAARGRVRCGRCGTTFDALETLREELPAGLIADAEEHVEPAQEPLHVEPAQEPLSPVEELVDFDISAGRGRRWPWAAASVVLALLLAAQTAHLYRAELSGHPQAGALLHKAYGLLGLEIDAEPRVELAAFALLHHEMVSHPRMEGGLHLSGVLVNDTGFAQPWPLLELRLENRFGEMVAARRLAPEEYLRNPPRDGELMPAHARRAIEIELLDPGSDAIGFSIDFCVESRAGLRCAASPPPP